ncbi:PTS mannose/fructose/sorbose/N-acetylgalactosamine transporter subunit IIC [Breznakia pachnodae]|uniref:PTS system mannose-specific IIC component n=1 Tax=Breznakia pachnodae TaxID=265178 RepID=A0ABU0E101_9FIRM|nr:PTS sugar transporter subunit IIC [Breznakia pachnodae]MDQ0360556.1 PTS system mannose-specific IIC component [Breznakia pachnodae]
MVVEGLLVALIMAFANFLDWGFGHIQPRPIWIGPLVGLVLGDLPTGCILGGMIEAVFMGTFSIGGSQPTDMVSASVFGVAFGILSTSNLENAVALAIPVGLLSVLLFNLVVLVFNFVIDFQDRAIANRNDKAFTFWHYFAMFFKPFVYGVMAFVVISVGSGAVESFMANLPEQVNRILNVMAATMPALGMAILVKNMWDSKIIPYYFLGFILMAYLGTTTITMPETGEVLGSIGLDTMSIAFIGACLGILAVFSDLKKAKSENKSKKPEIEDEAEDFLA